MKFENIMMYFTMTVGTVLILQGLSGISTLFTITGILIVTASIYYRWFE